VIVSSEQLPMLEASSLEAFRAFLTDLGFIPKIVACLRHPLERLSSQVSQRVGGGHDSLDTFRWSDDVVPTLTLFSKFFGRENMIVRRFDPRDFSDGDLVADFMAAIGHRPLEGVSSPRLNERLSVPAMAVADQLFEIAPLASKRRANDRYLVRIEGPPFVASRSLAPLVLTLSAASTEFLKREYEIRFEPADLSRFPDHGPAVAADAAATLAAVLDGQSRMIEELTAQRNHLSRRTPTAAVSNYLRFLLRGVLSAAGNKRTT
jgi:hypothetical protein